MRETVNINGVYYDAKTGLPVEPERPRLDTPPAKTAKKVAVRAPRKIPVSTGTPAKPRRRPAPSRTLNRRFVAKPPVKPKPAITKPVVARPAAARPIAAPSLRPTLTARPSPVVPRGTRRPKPAAAPALPPEPEISPTEKRYIKILSLIIAGVVVLAAVVSLLAYYNIPAVSFWVAASRAEVSAHLPAYTPDGYAVEGQAESSPGIVTINYRSPSNNYAIQMANSNWDSDGVLDNKVKPSATNYQTLNQKGLTIFVFGTQAMWVNGGILYTISSVSSLPNDEILKIIDGI